MTVGDQSATKSVAARFLIIFKNLAATDLVASRSPTSRRLLCNLAGTDRWPCCDLCDWWKLSVAERSQSGCNVCVTEALMTFNIYIYAISRKTCEYKRECKYCGMKLSKGELKSHISTYHMDRKYLCMVCHKQYMDNRSLQNHVCKAST